jgi:hypothetical protein
MDLTRSQIHFMLLCAKEQQDLVEAEMNKNNSPSSSPGERLHIGDHDDPETIREKIRMFKEQTAWQ